VPTRSARLTSTFPKVLQYSCLLTWKKLEGTTSSPGSKQTDRSEGRLDRGPVMATRHTGHSKMTRPSDMGAFLADACEWQVPDAVVASEGEHFAGRSGRDSIGYHAGLDAGKIRSTSACLAGRPDLNDTNKQESSGEVSNHGLRKSLARRNRRKKNLGKPGPVLLLARDETAYNGKCPTRVSYSLDPALAPALTPALGPHCC